MLHSVDAATMADKAAAADDDDDHNNDNNFNATSFRFRRFCSTNPVHPLHQPISHDALMRPDHSRGDNHIPAIASANGSAETRMSTMQCCCGRPDCAYLEHNNTALGGLERDLETAARLGQVRALLPIEDLVYHVQCCCPTMAMGSRRG